MVFIVFISVFRVVSLRYHLQNVLVFLLLLFNEKRTEMIGVDLGIWEQCSRSTIIKAGYTQHSLKRNSHFEYEKHSYLKTRVNSRIRE